MRELTRVEIDFVDRAPILVRRTAVVGAPVKDVFTAIARDPNRYHRWFFGFSAASNWVSAPPYGVGSRRTMKALGSTYEETVVAWTLNEEFSFRVDACPLPGHKAMAERWQMRALDEDCTEVTWSMAVEATRLAPVVHAIWSVVTRVMIGVAARGLSTHLGAGGDADRL